MVNAGMDVARLNLSHGTTQGHKKIFQLIREIDGISILIDLPGPKIRLGKFKKPIKLMEGESVHFTTEKILGYPNELPITYSKLPSELTEKRHIYINDGLIDILVTSIDEDIKGFCGKVIIGGEISDNKGVNVPESLITLRPPTVKDLEGIKFGVKLGCDWFAASFIRTKNDVKQVRKAIFDSGGDQPIVSKIEHAEAVQNIKEIVQESDAIMVARGDLGIEMPPWEIPLLQKRIINECNNKGRPVIVATQMLESMVSKPQPTRAEASDVANAILDGADAVMLSAETATGLFPVESVRAMNEIGLAVENRVTRNEHEQLIKGLTIPDVIGALASRAVEAVDPKAIIVVTRSGFSALMVSKHRPKSRILAICKDKKIARRIRLYWGVDPLDVPRTDDRDLQIVQAIEVALAQGFIDTDDVVMTVSGSTLISPGQTTTLEVLKVIDIIKDKDEVFSP
jgi:pyruvate kinase